MADSDTIKITKKDWQLLKMFVSHLTWGKFDATESWKAFVKSVESRFDEAAAPMSERKPDEST